MHFISKPISYHNRFYLFVIHNLFANQTSVKQPTLKDEDADLKNTHEIALF